MIAFAAALAAGLSVWWWLSPAPPRRPLRVISRHSSPVRHALDSWRRPRVSTSQARTIGVMTSALASELRSGQTPDQALQAVLNNWEGAIPGGYVPDADIVTVLTRWSRVPGWGGLAAVAICWRVADATGAGLADALDRIGEAMRHEHEVATEVNGQLAAVRATATVLATLPVVAVAMGHLLGARPLEVLVGTAIGAACLAAGVALAIIGWWWLNHQVESVRKTLRW